VVLGYFEYRKGEMTRRPCLILIPEIPSRHPFFRARAFRVIMMRMFDRAKTKIEESLLVMRRWRKSG